MIINRPPYVEQMIVNEAEQKGISIDELIIQTFYKQPYPKGDIRRLKGIGQSEHSVSIDEMNTAIKHGAVYGE